MFVKKQTAFVSRPINFIAARKMCWWRGLAQSKVMKKRALTILLYVQREEEGNRLVDVGRPSPNVARGTVQIQICIPNNTMDSPICSSLFHKTLVKSI